MARWSLSPAKDAVASDLEQYAGSVDPLRDVWVTTWVTAIECVHQRDTSHAGKEQLPHLRVSGMADEL
jgi:hypothetical protein